MKTGFLFPGYGNQFSGMAKDLYDNFRVVQELFEEAAVCLDTNFVKLCFASSESNLNQLPNAYVSLFLVSTSITKILEDHMITPSVVAGYDIGEYGALASVNGITVPDALYLLKKYGVVYEQFLEKKSLEAVRIQGVSAFDIAHMCSHATNGAQFAALSVVEPDNNYIVGGTLPSLHIIKQILKTKKIKTYKSVSVGGGIHASFMDEILKTMKMYLEKVDFKDTTIPFVAGVTGQALSNGDTVRAALMQQIHATLRIDRIIESFAFCDTIIIVGPGKKLLEMCKNAYPDKAIFEITNLATLQEVLTFHGKLLVTTGDDTDDK
jgi:[acyl-carrier-protein] S-malonyltransferase